MCIRDSETTSLSIQGDAKVARKLTVGISTPTTGGTAGDIVFSTKPESGGYAGWIYATDNSWKRFGTVFDSSSKENLDVDNINVSGIVTATDLHIPTFITHVGDTNTKFGFEGPDIITAYTNNNVRLRIDTDGAINFTGSTTSNLDYQFYNGTAGPSADTQLIIKTYANQGADPYIRFDSGGQDMIIGQRWVGTTNNYLLLGPGVTPSGGITGGLYILGNGKVGINSVAPASQFDVNLNARFNGDAQFVGSAAGITSALWNQSANALEFKDDVRATFGNSGDLFIEHDGDHSYVNHNGTGDLFVQTDGGFFVQKYGSTERLINANADGAVSLFHNGSEKLATTSSGVSITGNLVPTGIIDLADSTASTNNRIAFGKEDDFQIYYDGSNSYVTNGVSGGALYLQAYGENSVKCNPNSSVQIYHNGLEKLSTISTGSTCFGNFYNQGDSPFIQMFATNQAPAAYIGRSNRTGSGESIAVLRGDWGANPVGQIHIVSATDTTNKDNGAIHLETAANASGGLVKRLSVLQDGNVGINDSTPSYPLDVNGDIRSQSSGDAGLILQSPNGTSYRVTVSNAGALSVSAV